MRNLLLLKNINSNYIQNRNVSSVTAAVTKIHRTVYCRVYPAIIVQPDGSTITVRYHEPRKIIRVKNISKQNHSIILKISIIIVVLYVFQLPLDVSMLTEEQRRQRLDSRKPRVSVKIEEDLEDSYNAKKYLRYIKKQFREQHFNKTEYIVSLISSKHNKN